ncbi:MAG TPA: glycosyltransferase family 39 protein [Solirubrobacteraceae bacterium]|nr:glycosyltransferase family 39 protein [Solirubrobacteraceae bacterium]
MPELTVSEQPQVVRVPAARPRPAVSWQWLALAGITLLGAILRFATISSQSYWLDEAATVHLAHLPLGQLLHQVRVSETTPPLYFIVAWLWAKLFGTGEVGLRSLSALLGIGAIPLTYACGRELISRWAGLLAALFAAVSPFLIWYSQEARSYMLFAVLSGLSFLFFLRARRTGANRDIVWWAVFSSLAMSTHFFAGFLVAPEGILLLLRRRSRAVLLANSAVAAVQVAWLPLALSDTKHPLSWIKAFPLGVRIKQVPVDLGLSSLFQSSLVTGGLIAAAVLAVIVGLLIVYGRAPRPGNAAVAAIVAACVILLPVLLAPLGPDYVVPRNFIPAWIPLAVLLAAACTAPRTLPVGAALAALALGAFVWAGIRIDQEPQYQRPDWRGVAAAVGRPAGTRAIVAYDSGFASRPLAVYLPGVSWDSPSPSPVSLDEVDVVGSPWQTTPPRLPAGVSLTSSRVVGTFLVERFRLTSPWRLSPQEVAARAGLLLGPPSATPAVLIQRGPES